jgi:hypothetical protein
VTEAVVRPLGNHLSPREVCSRHRHANLSSVNRVLDETEGGLGVGRFTPAVLTGHDRQRSTEVREFPAAASWIAARPGGTLTAS